MMLQRKGLLSVVGAILVLAIFSMAFPALGMAQSQNAVRVKIEKIDGPDEAEFGDVLLIDDADDVILYGLNKSVPQQSQVTLSFGSESIERNASFPGKFPIRDEQPIRIPKTESDVSIVANYFEDEIIQSVTGNISLDFSGDSVRRDLPHKIVQIVEEPPTANPRTGYVLLTQRLLGEGSTPYIVDEFEGLSDGGSADTLYQSVPPFSQVEVYSEEIQVDDPDRTKRLRVIGTDAYFQGEFVSNGSFFPFTVFNANSGNAVDNTSVLWLRIIPSDGLPFLARINNDVSAEIESHTVANNNERNAANQPGETGQAIISGQTTDAYSLITAYAENDTTSSVLAQAVADEAGAFSMTIPAVYNADGFYQEQTEVYLDVLDKFGNSSQSLLSVTTDNEPNFFENPVAVDQGDGTFKITGVVEPAAQLMIFSLLSDGSVSDFLASMTAGADGSFEADVTAANSFLVRTIDQAGNSLEETTVGKTEANNPTNISFEAVYPDIIVSGDAEANAFIQIFAHYKGTDPDTAQTVETQPEDTFFMKADRADANGDFEIAIPSGLASRIIYVQAVDIHGNPSDYVGVELVDPQTGEPINKALLAFQNIAVTNNGREINDTLTAQVVDTSTNAPISDVLVEVYTNYIPDSEFLFYGPLHDDRQLVTAADGSFEITLPDRDPITGLILTNVYLAAFDKETLEPIGFETIDENDGLYRVGPQLTFAPLESDIQVAEAGPGSQDTLKVNRIYPANTPGTDFLNALPDTALPFVFVIADSNDDDQINVYDNDIEIIASQPLFANTGIPFPGSPPVEIGDNHWDAATQSVVGRTYVFLALMDQYGNITPDPIPVELDTYTADPNAAQIKAFGRYIVGFEGAVEAGAKVAFYDDANQTEWLGSVTADETGSFYLSGLTLSDTEIFATSVDTAGNESLVVKLEVNDPIQNQFMVMDGYGVIHTAAGTLSNPADEGANAVAFDVADDDPTIMYQLNADGTIVKLSPNGKEPLDFDTINVPGGFARDLEVISSNPFKGYVLLGNGVVISMGNAPFFGDMVEIANGYEDKTYNRWIIPETQLRFDDHVIPNRERDTEDKNNNGVLDIVIGVDGQVVYNEDTGIGDTGIGADNGQLDAEPLIDPANLGQGFYIDIARDLEVVQDDNGDVQGYVLMDGTGVLRAFGDSIGEAEQSVLHPEFTNAFATYDIFKNFELVVENGEIIDFIMINGFGQIFGSPGAVLGAGEASDTDTAGYLSFEQYGVSTYAFDIARDIEMSVVDSNGDGTIDYLDGFYILNGFGGIQAIGGALDVENAPYLGLDFARELEFGTSLPQ